MTYRDDLEASRARANQLEQELADAHRTIAKLKEKKNPPRKKRPEPPRKRQPRSLGKLCFTPPRTYFPLFKLLARAPGAILRRRPVLSPAASNSLLVVCAGALARLLFHGVYMPLYLAVLGLAVLPWACVVAVVGSVVLLPFIPLSRVTVGPCRTEEPKTWFHGHITDETATGFLFAITAPFPVLYPFTMPLVMTER